MRGNMKKYAVISDIHGNFPALQRILEDAREQGAQGFLLAGDYCISSPWAAEVVETIRSLENTWIVRGNEESYLNVPDGEDGQMEISRYGKRSLTEEQRQWLLGLPERLDLTLDGVEIHMTHNLETVTGKTGIWPSVTSETARHYGEEYIPHEKFLEDVRQEFLMSETFQKALETLPGGIWVFGHTHLQWHLQTERHLFINPGSCGIPLDCGDFGAPYTLLTIENGRASAAERRIKMDVEELIRQVKATPQYREARVWSEMIFQEWRAVRERMMFFLNFTEGYARSIGDERRPYARDTWEAAYDAFRARKEIK